MNNRPLLPVQDYAKPPLPEVVASPIQLAKLLEVLTSEPVVAVDTESNSLYAYEEQVCLIQFSVPGIDYVVDPLAGLDMSLLAGFFADPGIQKVFHAAEYDVVCLKRDFDFHFANLFDTMWGARILGWSHVGLGDVLREHFGVRTKKRYQRYNWGRRPLDPEALIYAAMDTHYLLPLRRLQAESLEGHKHMKEAREVFDEIAASEPSFRDFDADDFWRVKGAHDLDGRGQAVLQALFVWRDQVARRRNRPHFKVLGNRTLMALAEARPRTLEDLASVNGIRPTQLHRYSKDLLKAIRRGVEGELPEPPQPPPRHSEAEVTRFKELRAWRKQVAADRGVDPDVIISNAVLWALAEQAPRSVVEWQSMGGWGPWRQKTYGEAILDVLADL
jgi:ribonuclease D